MSSTTQESKRARVNAKGLLAAWSKALKETSGQGHFLRRGTDGARLLEAGILDDAAREILQRNLSRQFNPNTSPLFADHEDDLRQICGALLTTEAGPLKKEVQRLRRAVLKEISLCFKTERPLACKTLPEIVGPDVKHLGRAIQKTLSAVYSDAAIRRSGRQPLSKVSQDVILARLPLVQYSWPLTDLGRDIDLAVESTLRSLAATKIDNPAQQESYVRRALICLREGKTNLPLLKAVMEDSLLGIIKRAAEIAILIQCEPPRRKTTGPDEPLPMTPMTRYTNALTAMASRSHYLRPDSDHLFVNEAVFGEIAVNTKSSLGLADAFAFLPVTARLTGLLHENRDEARGEVTSMAQVRFKANGRGGGGTGLSSFEYISWRAFRDWGTIKKLKDSTQRKDERKLKKMLPNFVHRLVVVGACHAALTTENFNIDAYFKKMRENWASPNVLRIVDRMLEKLSGEAASKVWDDLGSDLRDRCLKSSGLAHLTVLDLVLTVSKELLDYGEIETKPIIDPPVPEFPRTYLQYAHVGQRSEDDDPLIRKKITVRIAEANIMVSPFQRPRLTIRRDLTIPVLSVKIFTSPQVRNDLPQDGNGSNSPARGNVIFQFDQASPPIIAAADLGDATVQPLFPDVTDADPADGTPVSGPPPTYSVYLLSQAVFAFLFFEILTRRNDRLAAKVAGASGGRKTPILMIRYAMTGRTADMQGEIPEVDEAEEEIETESEHDAAVRGIMRAIEFMLGRHRLVLAKGFCVKKTKSTEYRLGITLRAALAEMDADITVPGKPAFEKAVVCILTAGKSDGMFGADSPHDTYVQMLEYLTFDYTPGKTDQDDGSFRVRVHKRITELTSGTMRFHAMGDGYAALKELHRQGYRHCLFLSRSPFSHKFGITRDKDFYYCNPQFMNALVSDPEMAGMHLYPLLADQGQGVRKLNRDTAGNIASLFRITHGSGATLQTIFSPTGTHVETPSATARQVKPVCSIGTYHLVQGMDVSSIHCGLMTYTTPVDPIDNAGLSSDIRAMTDAGPVQSTIVDILTAIHLFRSQKGGQKDSAFYTLQPFRVLLSDEGESVRKLSQIRVTYMKRKSQLQLLALLHIVQDVLEQVETEAGRLEAIRQEQGEAAETGEPDDEEDASEDHPNAA
jgi:hypothetical protein